MTIQARSAIAGLLFALALILYGTAKHYSPILVLYVVEQSLIQKAPAGTDLAGLHGSLNRLLASESDQNERMKRLLRISEYLEKVQHLTKEDLDRLLKPDKS